MNPLRLVPAVSIRELRHEWNHLQRMQPSSTRDRAWSSNLADTARVELQSPMLFRFTPSKTWRMTWLTTLMPSGSGSSFLELGSRDNDRFECPRDEASSCLRPCQGAPAPRVGLDSSHSSAMMTVPRVHRTHVVLLGDPCCLPGHTSQARPAEVHQESMSDGGGETDGPSE